MTKWINVKDRLPDSIRQEVVVFAPNGLYEDDCGQESYHVLMWYKNGFSEENDRHREILKKITHWMRLPEAPHDQVDKS